MTNLVSFIHFLLKFVTVVQEKPVWLITANSSREQSYSEATTSSDVKVG